MPEDMKKIFDHFFDITTASFIIVGIVAAIILIATAVTLSIIHHQSFTGILAGGLLVGCTAIATGFFLLRNVKQEEK